MKHVVGILYLSAALVGFYWSFYLTMTGLYGVPFSPWYIVLFVGALVMLIGAIFWWTSAKSWTRWFPIIGSGMLAAFFLPALVARFPDFLDVFSTPTIDNVFALGSVLLVTTSLAVAVRNRAGARPFRS